MNYVLDATAIRSGMTFSGEGWFTTPGVVKEIKLGRQARNLELLLETAITVRTPGEEYLERVRQKARETHDLEALSQTDLDVLALALEMNATLISDDYAVQNIAALLEIEIKTGLEGIREIVHWTFRCRGCGKYFDEQLADCPVCGSGIRRVKRK